MMAPAIPSNEAARLDALYSLQILGKLPEERFDRLTRMAKRLFDVPIAAITLVDADYVWLKSCGGLVASGTSRNISFCGHTILGDDVFMVPNALEDYRFIDNPFVTGEPHILFYAGCPLSLTDEIRVGTFCVIDFKPRNFNEEDKSMLRDLADIVVDELNAHQIATIDELTHISNRRGFFQIGDKALKFCAEHSIAASLVFIDMDKFKPINDIFGHSEGDRVLEEFAATLKHAFRGSDLVGRLGGDEFVALMIDIDRENTERFMHKIAERIQIRYRETERPYDVGFSFGTVEFDPERHSCLDQVIAEADALMYVRKAARH